MKLSLFFYSLILLNFGIFGQNNIKKYNFKVVDRYYFDSLLYYGWEYEFQFEREMINDSVIVVKNLFFPCDTFMISKMEWKKKENNEWQIFINQANARDSLIKWNSAFLQFKTTVILENKKEYFLYYLLPDLDFHDDPLVFYFNFEEGFVRIDYKDFVLKRFWLSIIKDKYCKWTPINKISKKYIDQKQTFCCCLITLIILKNKAHTPYCTGLTQAKRILLCFWHQYFVD